MLPTIRKAVSAGRWEVQLYDLKVTSGNISRKKETCVVANSSLYVHLNTTWEAKITPKSLWMVIAAMKLKDACSLKEKL